MNRKSMTSKETELKEQFEKAKAQELDAIFNRFEEYYESNPFLSEEKIASSFLSDKVYPMLQSMRENVTSSTSHKNMLLEEVFEKYSVYLREANPEFKYSYLCMQSIPKLQEKHQKQLAKFDTLPANYAFNTQWIEETDSNKWISLIAKFEALDKVMDGQYNLFSQDENIEEIQLSCATEAIAQAETDFERMPQKAKVMFFHFCYEFYKATEITDNRSVEARFISISLNKKPNPKLGYSKDIYKDLEKCIDTFDLTKIKYTEYINSFILPYAEKIKLPKEFQHLLRDKINEL
ncbi:hypothetical protein [Sediminitomix flava]|uniref:Uncharacterized protein n=1 Tax=Sediminitomix flava TaxID=379075 RepID=A0A315ZC05_SEDFL|nr:hypothetical protein [Sediminitomix flava]PWJ42254.1 hypothetical protein BC781_103506 [Sediminitomix flava]